jgi:hypothetical protein
MLEALLHAVDLLNRTYLHSRDVVAVFSVGGKQETSNPQHITWQYPVGPKEQEIKYVHQETAPSSQSSTRVQYVHMFV